MTMSRQLLLRLRNGQRGTATIETAIGLPVLLFMCLGFVDLTMGFAEKLKMQQHAQSGADLIVANFYDMPDDARIKTEISNLSGVPEKDITLTRTQECDGVPVALGTVCSGADPIKDEYMQVDLTRNYEPVITMFGMKSVPLTGSVTIRLD